MKHSYGISLLFFLLLWYPLLSQSLQDSVQSYTIEDIVISANRFERPLSLSPQSITIISKEEIMASLASTVPALLTQKSGLYIIGTDQYAGANQSLFLRGTNSNHYVILIDGLRINDPSSVNNVIDLNELSLLGVERIEILKSSNTTLYGSSAIGGVINIITQSSAEDGIDVNYSIYSKLYGSGKYDISNLAELTYGHAGIVMAAGLYSVDSKGIDATIDTITDPNVFNNPDRDNFEKLDYYFKVGIHKKRFKIFGQYKKTNQRSDIDNGAYRDDDTAELEFERDHFRYGLELNILRDFRLKYEGQYYKLDRRSNFPPSVIDELGNTDETTSINHFNGYQNSNEIFGIFQKRSFSLISGLGFLKEEMNAISRFQSPFFTYESDLSLDKPFVHQSFVFFNTSLNQDLHSNILGEIVLEAGARYVHYENFKDEWTYSIKFGAGFHNNLGLFVNYAEGYNVPSLYQLYFPERDFISGITLGNPFLKPEKSHSFELGLRYRPNERFGFSLSYFNTRVLDLIEFVYLWDSEVPISVLGFEDYRGASYLNLGAYRTTGIDISLHFSIHPKLQLSSQISKITGNSSLGNISIDRSHVLDNQVQLFGNGTFLKEAQQTKQALIRRPSTLQNNFAIQLSEESSLQVNHQFTGKRLDIAFNAQSGPFGALASSQLDSYHLFGIQYKLTILKAFSISLGLQNIFNTHYVEINGFNTRGRKFLFKLSF